MIGQPTVNSKVAHDSEELVWLKAPEHPVFTNGEVHIWRVDLNQDRSTTETLSSLLSADEWQRANKYYFRRDRERFVIARGMLRTILSRYLHISPEQIRFSFNPYGKPALDHKREGDSIRFNLAHSSTVALFAFTRRREIGIDIEYVARDCPSLEIAEHFFSPIEATTLRRLPLPSRTNAFYSCWTRKEAYIKARGNGLSYPLRTFTVSLTPGQHAALLKTDEDPLEASRWTLVDLFPGKDYRAALAIEGDFPVLHCWHWSSNQSN